MIKSYYPTTNDNRADWWQNIAAANNETFVGLTGPEIDAARADAAMAVYLYRTVTVTSRSSASASPATSRPI